MGQQRWAEGSLTTFPFLGADVNVYASSAEAAAPLIGNHENTDVGKFLRDYLELDVDKVTEKLRRAEGGEFGARGWMGAVPMHDQRLDGQDHMDHYRGDSKKHKRCEICSA